MIMEKLLEKVSDAAAKQQYLEFDKIGYCCLPT